MDADFIIKYDTTYDERGWPDDNEDEEQEDVDEYGQPVCVPPWEMEY